jgi:hypothetical protein
MSVAGEGEEAPSTDTQLWRWWVRERRRPVSAVGVGEEAPNAGSG